MPEIYISEERWQCMLQAIEEKQRCSIKCKDEKEVKSMKCLLIATSPVFKDIFEGDETCSEIRLNYSLDTVRQFLRFAMGQIIQNDDCTLNFEECVRFADQYETNDFLAALIRSECNWSGFLYEEMRDEEKDGLVIEEGDLTIETAQIIKRALLANADEDSMRRWEGSLLRYQAVRRLKVQHKALWNELEKEESSLHFTSAEEQALEKAQQPIQHELSNVEKKYKEEEKSIIGPLREKVREIEKQISQIRNQVGKKWNAKIKLLRSKMNELQARSWKIHGKRVESYRMKKRDLKEKIAKQLSEV